MKKDDYFVIVYRILAYLYECMKAGESADLEYLRYGTEQFPINQIYWSTIWENILEQGYVRGATPVLIVGGRNGIKIGPDVRITAAGIQYMMENTAIEKAKDFLREIKEIVPGL